MKPEFIKQIEDKGYLVEIPEKDPNTAIVCLLKKGDKVHTDGFSASVDKKIQTVLEVYPFRNVQSGIAIRTDLYDRMSSSWFKKIEP